MPLPHYTTCYCTRREPRWRCVWPMDCKGWFPFWKSPTQSSWPSPQTACSCFLTAIRRARCVSITAPPVATLRMHCLRNWVCRVYVSKSMLLFSLHSWSSWQTVGQKVWCSLWETTTMKNSYGPPAESWRCFLSVRATSRLSLTLVSVCVCVLCSRFNYLLLFVSLLSFFYLFLYPRGILLSLFFHSRGLFSWAFCIIFSIISQSPSHFFVFGAFCIFFSPLLD